jgi:hypothetical protein
MTLSEFRSELARSPDERSEIRLYFLIPILAEHQAQTF